MDATPSEALIDALEVAFTQAAETDMYRAMAAIRRFTDEAYPLLRESGSRASLSAYLGSLSDAEQASLISRVPLFLALPRLATEFLNNAIRQTAATLPAAPVGRPAALTVEEERAIIQLVSELYAKGVRLGIAQKRASQKLGRSTRTIQRAWRRRSNLPQPPALSIHDVWKVFERKL